MFGKSVRISMVQRASGAAVRCSVRAQVTVQRFVQRMGDPSGQTTAEWILGISGGVVIALGFGLIIWHSISGAGSTLGSQITQGVTSVGG